MAKIACRPTISACITIELNEEEAAALDAMVGYGPDTFLEAFYKHLGRGYLEPHESGLRSLFDSVRSSNAGVLTFLNKARDARDVFNGNKRAVAPAATVPVKKEG